MSGPYVYTPHPSQVTYRNSPYLAPFYRDQPSPFIPELNLSASPFASPYHSPNTLNSPLPTVLTPGAIPFPSSPGTSPYEPPSPWRDRRLSGGLPPAFANPTWLNLPPAFHQRSRSDAGRYPYQPQPNTSTPYNSIPYNWYTHPQYIPYRSGPPNQSFTHPFLNAGNPMFELVLDLSAPQFLPRRIVGNGQTALITAEELNQQAFYPPRFGAHIVCDLIPTWPIDIVYNATGGYPLHPPPLTVGDVLCAIWNAMQNGITQVHWAALDPQQEHMVSRTYTKRVKRSQMEIKNQGVKKVDFLLGKVWFKGLHLTGDEYDTLKMIVV